MPIRMTDDPEQDQPQYNNDDNSGGRGGGGGIGGGGLLGLLPLVFGLFRSKTGIVILIIGAAAYFMFGRGCNMGSDVVSNITNQLKTGGILDPQQFQKANIYEPLTDDNTKNPLPESANLQKYAPSVGDQGHQGSCVAWSSAYAARSILESARTGQPGENVKFSPSFLYNQIGLDGCEGSYIERAMDFMTKQGSVPYNAFPYTDKDCSSQPGQQLVQEAGQYKMRGYNRLTIGNSTNIDQKAIKQNLSQGAPVAIGMMVGQSFMQDMMGKDVWQPSADDKSMQGFGGHAMCVVGYDDAKYGGSFLIMNSWGPQWGTNGFAWVQYPVFKYFVREAYGLEPMQRVGAAANQAFQCEVGLVQEGKYIPLRTNGDNKFITLSPLKKGSKFKMEVKNSTECYVYVFGKDIDGSSYTLFPYPSKEDPAKTKYAPFCGIAGYRLFPRDKSLTPDSIGTRDMMAVVVSKKPLDWYRLNQQITQNPQQDYGTRLNTALGSQLIKSVRFQSSGKGNMQFSTTGTDNDVVACIVEIDKN
jgi:Papain family cysteine protease